MSGNAWEWCNDNFTFYGSDSVVDPFGPGTEAGSVVRGGSDYNMDINLRSACREYQSADFLSDWLTIGFRCVKR
jgi:formylglycine-generating enzyme required for sulfatase activity